jgi:hypothetical protein
MPDSTKGLLLTKNWYCPNCSTTHQSQGPKVATHACAAFNGLQLPMFLEGSGGYHKPVYREDYIGPDLVADEVHTGHGKIVSAVSQEYPDGSNGLVVIMPCAVINTEAMGR